MPTLLVLLGINTKIRRDKVIIVVLLFSGFAILFLAVYPTLTVSKWNISSNLNIGSNWVVASNSVPLPIPAGISISIIKKTLEFFIPILVVSVCVATVILSQVVRR